MYLFYLVKTGTSVFWFPGYSGIKTAAGGCREACGDAGHLLGNGEDSGRVECGSEHRFDHGLNTFGELLGRRMVVDDLVSVRELQFRVSGYDTTREERVCRALRLAVPAAHTETLRVGPGCR